MSNLAEEMLKSNPAIQALMIAKQAMADVTAGNMSEFALNEKMQWVCKYFYSGSMAAMLKSEAGAEFLRPRTTRLTALENADLIRSETGRSSGGGAQQDQPAGSGREMVGTSINEDGQRRRRVTGAPNDPRGDSAASEDDAQASFVDAVKGLMARGHSYDSAVNRVATEKHRAEKTKRGW